MSGKSWRNVDWRGGLRRAGPRLAAAWRDRRGRRVLAAFAGLAIFSCGTGSVVAGWTRACAGTCPSADQIATFAPQQASQVLDARGGLLGSFYRERRTVIQIRSLPRYVPMAFVAIEDARFFEHEGVDPVRMIGAVRDNIVGGWGGPGGSTITMQLARNLFPQQLPASEKSLRRKSAEIKLALQMERSFSKERILEMYMNHIYLGAGAFGVEAAARTYFGKPASQLDYAEAATLAGLAQAPSAYNPREHADRAERRRNRVLRAMREEGVITAAQEEAAVRRPLVVAPPSGAIRAPYFVERVRLELEARFGELLYTGGLRIHTGIDPVLQATAEKSLEDQIRRIERGTYGGYPHMTYERFSASLAPGQAIRQTPYLQGVVVVMDPRTGLIRALVGGRDFRHSQFNRATQALRQAGSAFKPFVYGAALEKGRSPLYPVLDAPVTISMSDGTVWAPKNYDSEYGGPMTLRAALRNSRNMVAIRLGREVGIAGVRSLAERAGIGTRIPGYPSVYIGSAGVYPIQLIAAYAPFGNGGWRADPRYVTRVEDHQGTLLWVPESAPRQAVDPAVAWILTDMLREVVDRGTGYAARDPAVGALSFDVPAAGKTGTTNDATDVWFVGYTPDLLAGVWLGFDNPRSVLSTGTGGTLAVPVWARVMRTAYLGRRPPEPWARPASVVSRRVSGGRVLTEDCPWGGGAADFFAARFAPEPTCAAPQVLPDRFVDPTPHLPGRPLFPGQAKVPRPEDYVKPGERPRP